MKPLRLPTLVWALALAASLASILAASHGLPDRVASHFSASGRANGWSSRADYEAFFALVEVGLAVFVPALIYSFRYFPSTTLNVPNSGYWRSAEHYRQACDFLFRHALWFGAMIAIWAGCLNLLVARANRSAPPHLSSVGMALLTVALLGGIGVWIRPIFRFFRSVSNEASLPN